MHWNRVSEDVVDEVLPVRVLHGGNSTLRQRQIDGLREIQWNCRGITKIYHLISSCRID
jgi:hypothetical protein